MPRNAMPTVRELTVHRTNGLNEQIRIFVLDTPGAGGACHAYAILVPQDGHDETCSQHSWDADRGNYDKYERYRVSSKTDGGGNTVGVDLLMSPGNREAVVTTWDTDHGPDGENPTFYEVSMISFQNGPVKEEGFNGLTQEALFAVIIDRLNGFQSGAHACRENDVALIHAETAMLWLAKRTLDRVARNVEGTSQR